MATEHVPLEKIEKPCKDKHSALSETNDNHPLPLGGCTELYSTMARTRTGIQNGAHRSYRNTLKRVS